MFRDVPEGALKRKGYGRLGPRRERLALEPPNTPPSNKSLLMRLVPILLFVVAVVPRLYLWWARNYYGLNQTPPGTLTPLDDFDLIYAKELGLLSGGYLPYRDILYHSPPFFLYLLYPFYVLGGPSAASLPIVLSDAVAPVLVYFIARRFASTKIAVVAGLSYAFSPVALYFEGYLWFNSQPTVLLALLSILLLQEAKSATSGVLFGVASMFKQDALFVLPALLLWPGFRRRVGSLRWLVPLIGTMVVGSLPFLILVPIPYLKEVAYGLLGPYNPTQVLFNFQYTPYTAERLLGSPISILVVVLALSLLPVVASTRRWNNSYLLAATYSSIVFLVAFTFTVHFVFRYYLLLPYALMTAASTRWRTVPVPILSMVLSIFLPEGDLQLILLSGALYAFISLQHFGTMPEAGEDTPQGLAEDSPGQTTAPGFSNQL